jgi:hypothetical protein
MPLHIAHGARVGHGGTAVENFSLRFQAEFMIIKLSFSLAHF